MSSTSALKHPRSELILDKEEKNQKSKTYNSGYTLVVAHLTTNPPVRCLNMAERTESRKPITEIENL